MTGRVWQMNLGAGGCHMIYVKVKEFGAQKDCS